MRMSSTNKIIYESCPDEKQSELYTHFQPDSFLGNQQNVDHFIMWTTFFRRNFHRCAIDYLGLRLHLYQVIMLYLMGICRFFVTIASRACAKSFIIAVYSCIKCILYPGTIVVIASSTKGQSKLIISEKIQNELVRMSPVLAKEIEKIKDNQAEMAVFFHNRSRIRVVPATDHARGSRSTVLARDEYRMLNKAIDDAVLSPFQISRQPVYMQDEFYSQIEELKEESMDIYISSSWFDNGHWMWQIADQAYEDMLNGKEAVMLAFDESIPLREGIKTMRYFQTEKRKQDRLTYLLEFENARIKENKSAFFTYSMLQQNQRCMQPFYPKTEFDFRGNRKNPYFIPKKPGEIRLIGADLAFVENANNDNSIFTCMRLLPETTTYKPEGSDDVVVDSGYRRVINYMESMQGGETRKQAIRIRQLMVDFDADYIVLDTRNGGITCFDFLARPLYDDGRNIEYGALTCMNDDGIANRIKVEGAEPRIFAVIASAKLNSDIAIEFRRCLSEKKIDLLVNFESAQENILPNIREYMAAEDGETSLFYERPFLETQEFISETTSLLYEKKPETGIISISEKGMNRKDRYTSASYTNYFASLLEKDQLSHNDEYEYTTFID